MNIVVIGGTSGIGESLVYKLAELGNNVVFYGRNKVKGIEIAASNPGYIRFQCLDIRDENAVAVLDETANAFGKIDAVFYVSGVMYLSYLLDMEIDDWIEMIDVNYVGLLKVIKSTFGKLGKGASFINISSVAALSPAVGNAAYAASKVASDIVIDNLRKEAVKTGIKVCNIHLGGVATDINSKIRNPLIRKTISLRTKTYTPLKVDDVVNCLVDTLNQPVSLNIANQFITPVDQPD